MVEWRHIRIGRIGVVLKARAPVRAPHTTPCLFRVNRGAVGRFASTRVER